MNNEGYAGVETDVVTPREEKKSGGTVEGPTRNERPTMGRAALPPITIAPRGYQTQQSTDLTLGPQTPPPQTPLSPCETQPMMGYVPPRATYIPQQANPGYIPPRATYSVPPTVAQPINPNTDYSNSTRPKWAHKCAMGLSIVIIISGVIIFIMNIVGLVMGVTFAVVGTGFWGGIFMMTTGGIGVCASKIKSSCTIVSLMVLAIILAVLSVVAFGLHTTGALLAADHSDADMYDYLNYEEYNDYFYDSALEYIENYNCTHPNEIKNGTYCNGTIAYRLKPKEYEILKKQAAELPPNYYDVLPVIPATVAPGQGMDIAFNATLTVFGLLVFVICIIASALTCRAMCCRSFSNVIQVIYVPATGTVQMNPPYTHTQGQYVSYGSNHQVVPQGQLQPQYVQNQGIVTSQNMMTSQNMATTLANQTGAMDYNMGQSEPQRTNGYATRGSPPPAYQPYQRNEMMTAVD